MSKLDKNYLNVPILYTNRLILSNPTEEDYEHIQLFLQSSRSKYIGGPYTNFTAWLDYMANIGHWSLYGYGLWSIKLKKNNRIIGRVGLIRPKIFDEQDLAWQLFEGYEGYGYAFEAASTIKKYAIDQIRITSLASHILEDNFKSISLAEKLEYNYKKKKIIMNKKFIIFHY